MKKLCTIACLLTTLILSPLHSLAAGHFTMTAKGRTKPQSVNLVAAAGYDYALWGDPSLGKADPMYGYLSVGTRFGGSPTLSGYFQLSPISPVVMEVERSMTHRFSRTPNFPCDEMECKGRIDRTDFSIKGAAAYKDFVFLGGVLWRDLKTMETNTPVIAELEDLVVTPGNHRFFEGTVFFGYNLDELQTVGVLYGAGEFKDLARGYQSTYALYRTRWNEYGIAVGAGTFKSDYESLNGFSAIVSVSRQWGQRMSLF